MPLRFGGLTIGELLSVRGAAPSADGADGARRRAVRSARVVAVSPTGACVAARRGGVVATKKETRGPRRRRVVRSSPGRAPRLLLVSSRAAVGHRVPLGLISVLLCFMK